MTQPGRFVCVREAKIEFGEAVAKKLKLSKDGTKVLWPQPTDDPEDPQNVNTLSYQDLLHCTHQHPASGRTSAKTSSYSLSLWRLSFQISTPALVLAPFSISDCSTSHSIGDIGIADIFALATQYDTTTGHINNLTSKYVFKSSRSEASSDFHL